MFDLSPSHPEDRLALDRALPGRAEAQARAAYLAIVGLESAATFIGRAAITALHRLVRGYRRARSRRLTIQALSKLDDRMLRDVGIDPGSLEHVAAALAESPSRPQSGQVAIRPYLTPALPLLRLDLDCPDLKHAA